MIAPERYAPSSRVSNVRTAKNATAKRRKHVARARYAHLMQFSVGLAVVLALVMGYVLLMSNLTSLNYKLAKAEQERAALTDQTMRLDDRLATLRSQERLARIAVQLGMRDPQQFALVTLPPAVKPVPDDSHVAVLSELGGLFAPRNNAPAQR